METFDSLLAYCQENNRAIPSPQRWNEMFGRLKNTKRSPSGGWEPPQPLILAAWHVTMPIEKVLRFKEHLKWAERQEQLDEIGSFLRSLGEDEWMHYGDLP